MGTSGEHVENLSVLNPETPFDRATRGRFVRPLLTAASARSTRIVMGQSARRPEARQWCGVVLQSKSCGWLGCVLAAAVVVLACSDDKAEQGPLWPCCSCDVRVYNAISGGECAAQGIVTLDEPSNQSACSDACQNLADVVCPGGSYNTGFKTAGAQCGETGSSAGSETAAPASDDSPGSGENCINLVVTSCSTVRAGPAGNEINVPCGTDVLDGATGFCVESHSCVDGCLDPSTTYDCSCAPARETSATSMVGAAAFGDCPAGTLDVSEAWTAIQECAEYFECILDTLDVCTSSPGESVEECKARFREEFAWRIDESTPFDEPTVTEQCTLALMQTCSG